MMQNNNERERDDNRQLPDHDADMEPRLPGREYHIEREHEQLYDKDKSRESDDDRTETEVDNGQDVPEPDLTEEPERKAG